MATKCVVRAKQIAEFPIMLEMKLTKVVEAAASTGKSATNTAIIMATFDM